MINLKFWGIVKDKWIRDSDPTVAAVDPIIHKSGKTSEEINKELTELNGGMPDFGNATSIDDINNMMEQLGELGMEELPFDLFES